MVEHTDVLIIGAGLSGIAAGYFLQERCPQKTYRILEVRQGMGGTWDLFRYPGIRSDSDMHTLGYSFHPWMGDNAITDGESIRKYIIETAEKYGIDKHIRYQQHVITADWSSDNALWTLEVENSQDGTHQHYTCNFLYMATGYYDYEAGYMPSWQNMEAYQGQIVHPQKWTDDIDYTDKTVLIIGSGATAVTLVPAMAEKAKHITMLQRTPTYIVSQPSKDVIANQLHRFLPDRTAHRFTRWFSIFVQMYFYLIAQWFPEITKKSIKKMAQEELGEDFDVEKHMSPPYNPWDQRLCIVPDSDLFKTMRAGKASIVTESIETFTETGVRLASGEQIDADMIVTATGLVIKLAGGIQVSVDGKTVETNNLVSYKGAMYSNLPNLAQAFGYTNASWTLKCELIAQYFCRLINYMDRNNYAQCTPVPDPSMQADVPAVDLSSGYIKRAYDIMPKQGTRAPWRIYNNYLRDVWMIRFGRINDSGLKFVKAQKKQG